jgi:hypothetical protein
MYKPVSESTVMVKITDTEILTDLHVSATLNTKREGGFWNAIYLSVRAPH